VFTNSPAEDNALEEDVFNLEFESLLRNRSRVQPGDDELYLLVLYMRAQAEAMNTTKQSNPSFVSLFMEKFQGPAQQTRAWEIWRADKITGSKVFSLLDPKYFTDKYGSIQREDVKEFNCTHGINHEHAARKLFCKKTGHIVLEFPILSKTRRGDVPGFSEFENNEHLAVSVDGITSNGALLEIKCPVNKFDYDFKLTKAHYYWHQVQYSMHVLDLKLCYFVQYLPPAGVNRLVAYDKVNGDITYQKIERDERYFESHYCRDGKGDPLHGFKTIGQVIREETERLKRLSVIQISDSDGQSMGADSDDNKPSSSATSSHDDGDDDGVKDDVENIVDVSVNGNIDFAEIDAKHKANVLFVRSKLNAFEKASRGDYGYAVKSAFRCYEATKELRKDFENFGHLHRDFHIVASDELLVVVLLFYIVCKACVNSNDFARFQDRCVQGKEGIPDAHCELRLPPPVHGTKVRDLLETSNAEEIVANYGGFALGLFHATILKHLNPLMEKIDALSTHWAETNPFGMSIGQREINAAMRAHPGAKQQLAATVTPAISLTALQKAQNTSNAVPEHIAKALDPHDVEKMKHATAVAKSDRYLSAQNAILAKLQRWFREKFGTEQELDDVTNDHMKGFLVSLSKNQNPDSLVTSISTLKAGLGRFLTPEVVATSFPCLSDDFRKGLYKITNKPSDTKRARAMTPGNFITILDAMKNMMEEAKKSDKCVGNRLGDNLSLFRGWLGVLLGYYLVLRPAEIATLRTNALLVREGDGKRWLEIKLLGSNEFHGEKNNSAQTVADRPPYRLYTHTPKGNLTAACDLAEFVLFWKEEKTAHNAHLARNLSTQDESDIQNFFFSLRGTYQGTDIKWVSEAVRKMWQICLTKEEFQESRHSEKYSGYAIRRGGASGFYAMSCSKSETKKWGRWDPQSLKFENYIDENITAFAYRDALRRIFTACAPIFELADLHSAYA